jgi:hypothetical protein
MEQEEPILKIKKSFLVFSSSLNQEGFGNLPGFSNAIKV